MSTVVALFACRSLPRSAEALRADVFLGAVEACPRLRRGGRGCIVG